MEKGFTLLEILVTVSVLMIVGILLTQVFVTTIRTSTKSEIAKEVKQNGDFALDSMTRMIQNAQDVTTDCVDTGSVGSTITIKNIDGGVTTFECKSYGNSTASAVFRIASTSATSRYLTGPNVTLTGADCTNALNFTCTLLPSSKKSVGISFSLAQKGTPRNLYDQASEKFTTTVTLRNQ